MELSQNAIESQNEYEILTDSQISSKITEIIDKAEEYCFLVTPFFKKWTHLQHSFELASKQKKRIIFFFSDSQKDYQKKEVIDFYNKYNFDIIYIKNLHSKIYLNEKVVPITSMNLFINSQENNYEIGVLFNNKNIIKNIIEDTILGKIYKTGKIKELKGNYFELFEKNLFLEKNIRYCVHCGEPIKFISNKIIYCDDCHKKLKIYNSDNFFYCVICGKKTIEMHAVDKKKSSTCYGACHYKLELMKEK